MSVKILQGDVRAMLQTMEQESVHCVVTSVPYWGLRAYGTEPQVWGGEEGCAHEWGNDQGARRQTGGLTEKQVTNAGSFHDGGSSQFCLSCNAWRGEHGQEPTPELYIENEVAIWREVRRVLRKDGVAWLNIGDSYAGGGNGGGGSFAKGLAGQIVHGDKNKPGRFGDRGCVGDLKAKDLCLIPEQLAIALRADGWWIRSRIPWVKRSAMPDSTTDRPGQAVEYFFMLTRSARYFFDMAAVRQEAQYGFTPKPDMYDRIGDLQRVPTRTALGSCPDGKGGSRNLRNADLLFQSLEAPHGLITSAEGEPLALDVNTAGFSEAHFATFPPKLIEPLIKASTSERGCCVECGAPWVRVEEKTAMVIDRSERTHEMGRTRSSGTMVNPPTSKTLDWQPSCSCEPAEPLLPATVLDPFGGSGTTGLVADRLGRDAVLIELQPEYAEMAEQRIRGDAPLFTEVT